MEVIPTLRKTSFSPPKKLSTQGYGVIPYPIDFQGNEIRRKTSLGFKGKSIGESRRHGTNERKTL